MKPRRLVYILPAVLAILLGVGCGSSSASETHFNAGLASRRLDEALARAVVDDHGVAYRNAAITVDLPGQDFTYTGAAGIARADTGEPMTVDHQFSIASVGKPMTSVIIYQLWEEGAFGPRGLDSTLAGLDIFPPDVIDALHRIDGVSYGRSLTLRHLLTHTSGLRDVLMDERTSLGEDHPETMGYAPGSLNGLSVYDPERGASALLRCVEEGVPAGCSVEDYTLGTTWAQWDEQAWRDDPHDRMAGLLNFFLSGMNEAALCRPGECFHYADTNYILLGLVIERVTGRSLHHELRARIFDPLGMDHTYLAYSADPPVGPWEAARADHWAMNEPLISRGVNLSADWGGGGEVSTVEDLNTFIRALAQGDLFQDAGTLDEMLKVPPGLGNPYGSGIVAWPIENPTVLHHNGSNGSWIEYHRDYDLSIAGTVDDQDNTARFIRLRADIYRALAEAGLPSGAFRSAPATVPLAEVLIAGRPPSPIVVVSLIAALLIQLPALILWPAAAHLARARGAVMPAAGRAARWVAGIAILLGLAFLGAFVANILADPMQLMFGLLPTTRIILWLPYVFVLLAAATLAMCVVAWVRNLWRPSGRIHYTLIALSLAALAGCLYVLGLLGWQF